MRRTLLTGFTRHAQAVLGITISPDDERSHPNAPLLSAGTRRQSACMAFLAQAHQACFESSLAEEVSVENLAAILSLMQMSICELSGGVLEPLDFWLTSDTPSQSSSCTLLAACPPRARLTSAPQATTQVAHSTPQRH